MSLVSCLILLWQGLNWTSLHKDFFDHFSIAFVMPLIKFSKKCKYTEPGGAVCIPTLNHGFSSTGPMVVVLVLFIIIIIIIYRNQHLGQRRFFAHLGHRAFFHELGSSLPKTTVRCQLDVLRCAVMILWGLNEFSMILREMFFGPNAISIWGWGSWYKSGLMALNF